MDAKDVRIFCEMAFRDLSYKAFADGHVSPVEVGRKLGLDGKTVRVRVRKMEESGFIKYYQAMPNFALFGLRSMGSFRFEALNLTTKFSVLQSIHEVQGLVEASDYLGPFLSATIAGETSEEVQKVADGLSMRYELSQKSLGSRAVREPLSKLDGLDWQTIQKLRYEAKSTTKDIAYALSATPRMVSYRITKLLNSGAVTIRAVIDAQKQEGLIFYELEIGVNEESRATVVRQLKDRFGEGLWSMNNAVPGVILASFFCFTLGEPERSAIDTLKIEGVRRCSLYVLKEVLEPRRSSWVDALIEQKVSR